MNHTYTDFFGSHEWRSRSTWEPPTTCAECNLKVADDYGFCWIHKTRFVVATQKPGFIDTLPIKQELRRRMVANDYSVQVMSEILDVDRRRLNRILSPRTVWVKLETADFWFTKLHLIPPASFWEVAA